MNAWLPDWLNLASHMLFWSAITVALYLFAKRIYRKWPQWWLTPLAAAPAALIVAALVLHEDYRDYIDSAGWLVALLGPATVAFAAPIYQHRALIRRYWPILLAGMVVGSATAMATSWGLAAALGLSDALRLSLAPRSISTPFEMQVSSEIGGVPDLTAFFVVVTGVFGAVIGEFKLDSNAPAFAVGIGARRIVRRRRPWRWHSQGSTDRTGRGRHFRPRDGVGWPAECARRSAIALAAAFDKHGHHRRRRSPGLSRRERSSATFRNFRRRCPTQSEALFGLPALKRKRAPAHSSCRGALYFDCAKLSVISTDSKSEIMHAWPSRALSRDDARLSAAAFRLGSLRFRATVTPRMPGSVTLSRWSHGLSIAVEPMGSKKAPHTPDRLL